MRREDPARAIEDAVVPVGKYEALMRQREDRLFWTLIGLNVVLSSLLSITGFFVWAMR